MGGRKLPPPHPTPPREATARMAEAMELKTGRIQ